MPLYCWLSTYLENYARGTIVVAADSPEKARDLARAEFDHHDRMRHEYQYGAWADEDDATDIAKRRALLEADLRAEPSLLDRGALFVRGSE